MSMKDEISKQAGAAVGDLMGKIYDDVARPSTRQVGTSLETLFRVGLSPISMLS